MRFAALALAVAGCFRPSAEVGGPCAANGECPAGQQCDPSARPPTCVVIVPPRIDAPSPAHDAPAIDAPILDGSVDLLPWGTPTKLVFAGLPAGGLDDPTLTDDLRELHFNLGDEIYVAKRASTSAGWGTPVLAAALNSAAVETTPEITGDGLTIYIASDRLGTLGKTDIWVSTRPSRAAAWSTPVDVIAINSVAGDVAGVEAADALSILFSSSRGATSDIYISTRLTTADGWGAPVPVTALNDPATDELSAMASADGLSIYFESSRSGVSDLYVSRRASRSDPFGAPQPISELNTAAVDGDPWISPDRRHLFFASTRGGTSELYESTR